MWGSLKSGSLASTPLLIAIITGVFKKTRVSSVNVDGHVTMILLHMRLAKLQKQSFGTDVIVACAESRRSVRFERRQCGHVPLPFPNSRERHGNWSPPLSGQGTTAFAYAYKKTPFF